MENCYCEAINIHFPGVYYYSEQGDPDQILYAAYIKEVKQQFVIVHPLCCKEGKYTETRAPNNVATHCPR